MSILEVTRQVKNKLNFIAMKVYSPMDLQLTFCNVGYYFCYVPFKLEIDPLQKGFSLRINRLQQGIFIILTFLEISLAFPAMHQIWINLPSARNKTFFKLSTSVINVIYITIMRCCYSFKGKQALNFINHLYRDELENSSKNRKYLAYTVGCGAIFCWCCNIYIHFAIQKKMGGVTLHSLCMFYLSHLCPYSVQNETNFYDDPLSFIISLALEIYWQCEAIYWDVCFLFSCLLCLYLGTEFRKQICQEKSTHKVLSLYDCLRELFISLNGFISTLIFTTLVTCLPTHAVNLITIFDSQSGIEYITTFCLESSYIFYWLSAAEGNHRINYIKEWLYQSRNSAEIPNTKLVIMTNDLNWNKVSIGCRFFNVTYGLLGSMTGLIFTYAIIMVQFL